MKFPLKSTAIAYTDDLGLASGKASVRSGVGKDEAGREISHNFIVRSNDPDATQFCLGLTYSKR
jgi:hypothetical protein